MFYNNTVYLKKIECGREIITSHRLFIFLLNIFEVYGTGNFLAGNYQHKKLRNGEKKKDKFILKLKQIQDTKKIPRLTLYATINIKETW